MTPEQRGLVTIKSSFLSQESLVGWFATGNEITSHSALIHDYYARETKDPIHLTVDTTLNSGKLNLKAFVL